jgi:hypothetical protein
VTLFVLIIGPPIMDTNWVRNFSAYLPRPVLRLVAKVQECGLSPAMTQVVLTSHYGNFLKPKGISSVDNVTAALAGLLLYAGAAGGLWHAARVRFREEKGPPPNPRLAPTSLQQDTA